MNQKFQWFTSSFSSGNGQCAECARTPDGGMAMRDTKNRDGVMLRFTADGWRTFLATPR